MAELFFEAQPAFAEPFATSEDLRVEEIAGPGLASVMVRRGRTADLAAFVSGHFGVELPTGPRRTTNGDVAWIGTGPGVWLAMCDGGGPVFARYLAEQLGDLASVSDQSSGYVVLRLSGSRVSAVLQKGVPIDLHPAAFPSGHAAVTVVSHIGTMLWAREDDVFDVAFFRSMAGSFRHWLDAAILAPD